jgi:hypothetical protein
VYQQASHSGKRVQALGGAKNFIVVMPDADFDRAIPNISESFFGCAGERCLAGSVLLPVGEAHVPARDRLVETAKALRVGDGLEPGTDMGPVISAAHRSRVLSYVDLGLTEGASLALDGRARKLPADGYFVGPSVFDRVSPVSRLGQEEIFRSGGHRVSREGPRRSVPHHRRTYECECHVDFHDQRQVRARVRASRHGVDGRREYRRGRADGVLSRSAARATASSATSRFTAATRLRSTQIRK